MQAYSLTEELHRQHPEIFVDSTILINAIFEDRQNQIWIITDRAGLVKYDKARDEFEFILSQPNNADGLQYNFVIRTIFQDREDNIWLGTDRGISIFNPYRSPLTPIRPDSYNKNAPKRYEITDVLASSYGPILISTWGGGIYVYDQEWDYIRTIRFEGLLNYNLVWCFAEANDGLIWMGAQHGYVHIYNPMTGEVRTIQPPETHGSTIRVMTKDRDGNILLGLHNGRIVIWNAASDTFFPYNEDAHSPPIQFSPIFNLFIDAKNKCWVSTEYGLRLFDMSKRMITATYLPDPHYAKQSSTQMIQGIQDFNDTTLVLGTIDGGLYLFNTNDFTFSQKSMPPSLINTSIHAVRKDESGDIWITTDYGLFTFDPLLQKSRQYRFEQDLITSAFASCRFYPLPGDKWMTATATEVVYFHPDDMNDVNIAANTVEISGAHVFDEPLFIDSLRRQGLPIRLPFDQNFLTINFSLLDFSLFQQTQYMHRLTGVDKNWVVTTTEQQAEYTDLKPGEYLFEVKAQSGDQVTDVTTQSVIIMPPWYGTWWFRLLALSALIGILFSLVRYRIASIQKQGQLRQQVTEMEMMALRAQMNPHFIFNCINSIDAMIQSNDKYLATTYLNKFAKLIRNILDSSSHHKVPLSKDVETLRLYVELEQFRHENKFTVEIDADEMLLQGEYKVPPLIIQPYVENAILHGLRNRPGNTGKLQVSISKVEEHLLFCIEDNGVGRKTNGERSNGMNGMGMQLSSNRIRLFNDEESASVEIIDLEEHGSPCGTRVNVRLNLR